MTRENNDVSIRIKNIRKKLGLSMEEFGKLFDPIASKGVVSNWENNYNFPNNERLKAIADLGDITVNELMYGDLKQFIYNSLHDELLEVDELYHKIIEYIQLNDNDINEIDDENVQNDILQVSSESFLKDHFNSIYDYVRQNFPLEDIDGIYDSKDLFIERAISYVNNLIYNKKNNIIFAENFKMSYLKKITFENIEQFEDINKYIFNCRISLETTDFLDNRDYVELDYVSHVTIYIYINADKKAVQYGIYGLRALLDEPYLNIYEGKTYEIVKEYIVKEVLQYEELEEFNLNFDDLEELTL